MTAAWIASAVYVTTPAVLMNGRRAMFEGAHLAMFVLVALVAIDLARSNGRAWWRWILLGVLCGFALAAKHTSVFTVIAVFIALRMLPWLWQRFGALDAPERSLFRVPDATEQKHQAEFCQSGNFHA